MLSRGQLCRRRYAERLAKSSREIRVAVEPGAKCERGQVAAVFRRQSERCTQANLSPVIVERPTDRAAKRATKVEWRDRNASRQLTDAEVVEELRGDGGLCVLDEIAVGSTL